MSEFFEQGAGINSHLHGVTKQVEALHARQDIPQGPHIDMVLGMADIGGEYGSVLLMGDQGAGKSALAVAIEGSKSVIDVGQNDTSESLLGAEKQMAEGFTSGRIGALILANGDDVRLVLDELGHIENGRPLHRLWNGTGFNMHDGNRFVDTSSMSLIATSNYPHIKGGVFQIHKELRDRFGGGLALGSDIEIPGSRRNEPGLVAPDKVRRELREFLETAHPLHEGEAQVKPYVKKIITGMSETGMFDQSFTPKGARVIGGLTQAVRAKRLVSVGEMHPEKGLVTVQTPRYVTINDIATVAAFNLGKMAELSKEGERAFSKALGGMQLSEHMKEVISRRMIAGIARKALDECYDPTKLDMTREVAENRVKTYMDNYSFATLDDTLRAKVHGVPVVELIDEKIMETLFAKKDNNQAVAKEVQDDKLGITGRLRDRITRRSS